MWSKIWFWMGCWSSSFQWFSMYTILYCYTIAWASLTLPVAGPMGPMLQAQLRRHSACTNNLPFDDVHIVLWLELRMQDYSTWFTQIFIQFEQQSPKKNRPVRSTRWDWNVKCRETQVRCKQIFNLRFLKVVCQQWQGIQKASPSARGKVRNSPKTSAMMGIPVLEIQHAHIHDLKKFILKLQGYTISAPWRSSTQWLQGSDGGSGAWYM